MTGLLGLLGSDPGSAESALTAGAAALGGGVSSSAVAHGAGVALAALDRSSGVALESDILAAVWGSVRLDDGEPLDAARVARLYHEHGPTFASRLRGAFAIAVVDPVSNRAWLVADRFATRPLAFATTKDGLVFGSSIDALRAAGAPARRVRAQALYDYVYFHVIPGPDTVVDGVERLQGGESLVFENGRVRRERWWVPVFEESGRGRVAEYKADFVGALESAVRAAARGYRTGAFLSGGTDSSTVAGMLGRVTGEPARTYSIGFEAEGYDELAYARIAAKHFGTEHHEYYVTPDDIVAAIPVIAASYDQPFGNASAVPTYFCAKMAREDGVERLLGGDGGDELYGGNERYAKQAVFELYGRIPAPVRAALIEPLAALGGPLRKLGSYVEQAKVPMPDRLETYNLVERFGAARIFTADFLGGVDTRAPLAHLRRLYASTPARSLINRMLAYDFVITLADNDLPKVSGMCDAAGMDVAYPMLDEAVVDFSLALPPGMKLKGRRLRWFFKEALSDFLPAEIIAKRKHGFGLPFGAWLRTHRGLQALAYGSLDRLAGRGIVRREAIAEIVAAHRDGHAAFYGTLIWVLAMLEQWLEAHDVELAAA